jgi:polar amino acid transport system substrate-binding protein
MKVIMKFMSVLLICSIFSTNSFGEEIVRITNGEWAPFQSKNAKHYGYYSHIVTEAFRLVGVKIEYGFFPWKRAYMYAESGEKWDGGIAWALSEEREKLFYFSDPIAKNCAVFFYLKSQKFDWQTEDDLQGHKFGGTGGDLGLKKLEEIKKKGIQFQIQEVTTDLQNFRKLVLGRINVFPCMRDVGLRIIRKEFSSEVAESITYHKKPLYCSTIHAIFSKKSKKSKRFVELYNKGLKLLHESGKFDQLRKAFIRGEYK